MTDVSLLKSCLQKAVRRGLLEGAMSCALVLLELDLDQFLRRLAIIMIEDTLLTVHMSSLVWLMSAVSKGYRPSRNQVAWLMGLVSQMVQEKRVHPSIRFEAQPVQMTDPQIITYLLDRLSTWKAAGPLLSMMFRVAYGGLPWDKEMFRQVVLDLIAISLKADYVCSCPLIEPVDPNAIVVVSRSQLPIYGVDFHCLPILIDQLKTSYPEYETERIRQAIWQANSRINFRKPESQVLDADLVPVWSRIQATFTQLQMDYLR
jgi:hypothetical protein